MKIKNTLLVIFVSLMSVCTMAQVPNAMRFQTTLRDADGKLIKESNVGIRITIFAHTTATNIDLYAETFSTQTNADGIATVVFGEGTTDNKLKYKKVADIDWTNTDGDRWMRVEIDPNGGTNYSVISGESQLLSAPYALMAQKASQIGSLSLAKVKVKITGGGPTVLPTIKVGGTELTPNSDEEAEVLAYTPTYLSLVYPDNYDGMAGNTPYRLASISVNGISITPNIKNTQTYVDNLELQTVTNKYDEEVVLYKRGETYYYDDDNKLTTDWSATPLTTNASLTTNNTYEWDITSYTNADIIVGPFSNDQENIIELKYVAIIY